MAAAEAAAFMCGETAPRRALSIAPSSSRASSIDTGIDVSYSQVFKRGTERDAYLRTQLRDYARIAPLSTHAPHRNLANGPLEVGPDGAMSSTTAVAACRGSFHGQKKRNEGVERAG